MLRKQAVAVLATGIVSLLAGWMLAQPLSAQTPRGQEIPVSAPLQGVNALSQVAVAPNGDFVVAWQTGYFVRGATPRVWIRLFRADGAPKGGRLRVSNSRAGELLPRLAMAADGSFLVVWQGGSLDDTSVFGRRFTADGRPKGGRFLLSSSTEGSQSEPSAAFTPDGGFVAAWTSGPSPYPSKTSDVYARRFDPAGRPLGPDFPVNTTTWNEQGQSQVAVDGHGGFLIGWLSFGGEGAFYDVFARRFAAGGAPQGDDFQVNSGPTTVANQDGFAMALRDSGEAVFVWNDSSDPTSGGEDDYQGILGQRLAADNTPIGPLFHVNEVTQGAQRNPAIALSPDGGFLVVWTSNPPTRPGAGSPTGTIASRRFTADATPRGGELRIDLANGYSNGPAVALNQDGRGVVTWTRSNFSSSTADVVTRRVVQRLP